MLILRMSNYCMIFGLLPRHTVSPSFPASLLPKWFKKLYMKHEQIMIICPDKTFWNYASSVQHQNQSRKAHTRLFIYQAQEAGHQGSEICQVSSSRWTAPCCYSQWRWCLYQDNMRVMGLLTKMKKVKFCLNSIKIQLPTLFCWTQ